MPCSSMLLPVGCRSLPACHCLPRQSRHFLDIYRDRLEVEVIQSRISGPLTGTGRPDTWLPRLPGQAQGSSLRCYCCHLTKGGAARCDRRTCTGRFPGFISVSAASTIYHCLTWLPCVSIHGRLESNQLQGG